MWNATSGIRPPACCKRHARQAPGGQVLRRAAELHVNPKRMDARRALRLALLLLFALWCLFPVAWMLLTALKLPVDAMAFPPAWIFRPTLHNFQKVLSNPQVLGYLMNSIVVAAGSTGANLVLGIPIAYILARFHFRGQADYGFWILTTRMAPPVAMVIPFFVIFREAGLLDTRGGLILVYIAMNISIVVWVMRSFFRELPGELEEAGLVDGASYWQAFSRIILPLSWPGIVASGIIAFLFAWNEFLYALVLTNTHSVTVPVGLYTFVGYQQIQWGQLAAAGTVMLLPVLVFLFFFQRQLVRGLTFGAVRE